MIFCLYPCFYLSPFNCVVDQDCVGCWIEHDGDSDVMLKIK